MGKSVGRTVVIPDLFIFAAEVFPSEDPSLPQQTCSMYRGLIYSGEQLYSELYLVYVVMDDLSRRCEE